MPKLAEFSKKSYWARRSKNKRGQIEIKPKQFEITPSGVTIVFNTKGEPIAVNRKARRQRNADRDYTKPNVGYRKSRDAVPFTGHKRNEKKNPPLLLPVHPSVTTNHSRHAQRAAQRALHQVDKLVKAVSESSGEGSHAHN